LRDPNDKDALTRARAVFQDFTEGKSAAFPGVGKGSLRVLGHREIQSLHTNPRAALALEAADGYAFGNNYAGQPITPSTSRGTHGYLPSRYLNTFIASGAGINRRGLLSGPQPIRMIDLGPTIARVLKLKLRDAEGKAFSLK
jgi:hypothetical protein